MLRYRLRESVRRPFPCPKDMNPTLHALLVQRGIASEEEARRFLNPSSGDLRDPMLLSGMREAVERVRRAIAAREAICVYGDYDVDGVSASALLSDYLRSEGAQVEVYLPSRHTEGYGLNENAVRAVAQRNRLMITVDCGVTSAELIDLAQGLGMDCIVTDHHQPPEQLPNCPVVNPLLNGYPFGALCGAGVALKLVQALGGVECAMRYIDIAALATVADVVPLVDENRAIVKLGLERINAAPRVGIKALIDVSGLSEKKITAGNVAFQLAPRLNAGGRIGSARRSHDLLLSATRAEAQPIADELEQENRARKEIEQQILDQAERQLEDFDFPAHRALVIAGVDWNHGVIGLAASRLVEKYHYPTILLAESDGVLTGSCRSIPGVDIHRALCAVSKHLTRFGGHKQAAGLTLDACRLDDFRADLDAWLAENISPTVYIPEQEYDMDVHFDQLTEGFVAGLDALAPTGFGNPAPVLRALANVYAQTAVGAQGAHLKLTLSESSVQRGGIFFRAGAMAGRLPERVDALFSPKLETFRGRTSVQLELKSLRDGDVLSEICAKKDREATIQHEFLTEMLYNKEINYREVSAQPLEMDQLEQMLKRSPQGTLILTADLEDAQCAFECAEGSADVHIGECPDDARAFNAVCAYAPRLPKKGYRRIVLLGAPQWYDFSPSAQVYRVKARAPMANRLPNVDALREVYKCARSTAKGGGQFGDWQALCRNMAAQAGLDDVGAAACLIALADLHLIELQIYGGHASWSVPPMQKTDPESGAVWRAIQRWKREE